MNYFRVDTEDMVNGVGLRVVLWVAGCEHKCKQCHNPETWDKNGGEAVTKEVINSIIKELENDYHKGITISGGDPLAPYNRVSVTNLVKKIRTKFGNTKDIWVYTGYTYEEVSKLSVMKYIDVLVDGEFINELKDPNLLWRGSKNQRLIDINKTRKAGKNIDYDEKNK